MKLTSRDYGFFFYLFMLFAIIATIGKWYETAIVLASLGLLCQYLEFEEWKKEFEEKKGNA